MIGLNDKLKRARQYDRVKLTEEFMKGDVMGERNRWTQHVENQWQEYYKARQNWCAQKPETFLASLAPINDFARFLDKQSEQIREHTPYKNWHPTGVHPGLNYISLGVVDNFECVLEVDDKNRTFVAAFRATLKIGFPYHYRTGPLKDPVRAINEGFNMAKLGIKAEIEERTKLLHHYTRLEASSDAVIASKIKTEDE